MNSTISTWHDEGFLKEMKKRSSDFKSGKSKSYTWEQTKAAARKSLMEKPKNNAYGTQIIFTK